MIEFYEGGDCDEVIDIQWSIPTATLDKKEIEEILDSRVGRSTRNKTYEEYLVKWKGRLVEDSSWLAREEVNHLIFPLKIVDMMGSLLKLSQCLLQEHPMCKKKLTSTKNISFLVS